MTVSLPSLLLLLYSTFSLAEAPWGFIIIVIVQNANNNGLPIAESIKDAAATLANGLMKFYTGNNTGDTPGNLP